ncbi:MAG TPA: AAA family ATPase [Acidobacteriaceae bacterium]|nr:AAA family ATPase [Acidobacteriaceae bacterium]
MLQPKPFAVLRYLVENPGRLITHDELLDKLWPETYVQPQVLRTYMLELRKVLGDDPQQPRFIQTLPKRGYRFVAEVTEREEAPGRVTVRKDSRTEKQDDAKAVIAAVSKDCEEPPSIVDREVELAALRVEFAAVVSGQRRVVFVTGEAGIGKTALIDVFSYGCEVSSAGVCVARGQCVEGFGGREEYYPVMEALSQLCASQEGGRACEVLSRIAPAWLAAMGRHGTPAGAPHSDKMPGDLCAALEELAAEKPLLLVIEDLHWADEATLQLVSALARRRAAARLMIVATCRPRDMHAEQPLKALRQDLRMRRLCAEICMTPLPKQAVCALLSRELKQESLPKGLGGFVHQRSEGNPLFVIAILEHLIAQEFLMRAKGTEDWELHGSFAEMEASVPDGLAQMIEIEIDRLSEAEQRLLEAGSLFSVAFPSWAVAAALNEDFVDTEEACDGLARKLYFVQKAGQDELPDGSRSTFYAFTHDLYREVLYRRQSESRRARRHTRVAERLSVLFAEREDVVAREMAMHFEAAGEWRRAIAALRAAAQHAQARQQGAEATELLERALEISGNLGQSERASLEEAMRMELAGV